MSTQILYEQPLNERMRAFLRLEHLFHQVHHFRHCASIWDSHASVTALIEIFTILDRSDIRSEIIKELERHISNLSKLIETPLVDRVRLETTLQELTEQLKNIQLLPNKLGAAIRESDLLNSVRQRTVITGGTCGFDIPAYHYWLNLPVSNKTQCISHWLSGLNTAQRSIEFLLTLTRNSALFEQQVTTSGFYQRSLDTQNPCQLLRIALCSESNAYPEISGNKHRANIRFLAYSESERPKQIEYELEFAISCCSL